MAETISSGQNPKIKQLLALEEKSRLRRESGLFVLEGRREILRCLKAGYLIDTLFVCPEICGQLPRELRDIRQFEVTPDLYSKIAYRGGTEGLIAEVNGKAMSLEELRIFGLRPDNKKMREPLIVVLESVEKPGNIGAVLRSADAAGADAVIICDPLTDLYNPNLLRASTGALFSQRVVCCTSQEAIAWLKGHGVRIYTAQLQDSSLYYETDFSRSCAIVIGTEATGLSVEWRLAADAHVRIPMLGAADSLNASVSAAILLYEALRQRRQDIRA